MDFAIIETGGKQYRVSPGDELDIELVSKEPKDKLEFNQVLLVKDGDQVKIGKPYLKDVQVVAELLGHKRGKKIRVARFRAKSRYRRVVGHRQSLTRVKIKPVKKVKPATRKKATSSEKNAKKSRNR